MITVTLELPGVLPVGVRFDPGGGLLPVLEVLADAGAVPGSAVSLGFVRSLHGERVFAVADVSELGRCVSGDVLRAV